MSSNPKSFLEKADQHLAWQQRLGWEDRAKKNFDSWNQDMMSSTGTNWDRRGKSNGSRKPTQSMVRYRNKWDKLGEPDIKAELMYSPLKCAWVYREPSSFVNQEYHHPSFNNISKVYKGGKTQTNLPRIDRVSEQQVRKPRHTRGKSYAGAMRRKLDESIERTSEMEDKVSYMRMKLSQRLTSPQFGQSEMNKTGPTFYKGAP